MTRPLVAIRGVSQRFGGDGASVAALEGIDLDIPDGQFVSVVGPSGCGKSTLLSLVEGAARMLALTGLAGFENRLPHQLSGGMKQRVAIARGLVQNPAVLLMDEPFASLDEQTRMVLGDELLRIWSETRKTVLFVTHSLNEAVYLADRVVVLSARPGRVVDDVAVDLPRPRSFAMTSSERFGVLKDRIWQHIKHAERR